MYQRTNTEEVEVKVHKGTLRDAQFYSLGVNDDNGLRRTIADKCKAVKTAFDDIEWSDLSDNKIAKQCKVSHTFVSNLRKKLSIERQASKTVTMRGKKTTMDTTNIGKKPAKEGPEAPKENPEIEESIKDYDPKDDQIIELSTSNEDLRAQNEAYKAKEMILSGDQAKIDDEITGLRNQIKALEAELRAVKNSRDQFQAKNAELIKQVNYYKKQLDKIKQ
jgi:chromosome segregation ATPase